MLRLILAAGLCDGPMGELQLATSSDCREWKPKAQTPTPPKGSSPGRLACAQPDGSQGSLGPRSLNPNKNLGFGYWGP